MLERGTNRSLSMIGQVPSEIERMRSDIETIDLEIVTLMAKRINLCRALTPFKMTAGLEAHIPHRVKLVVDRWMAHAVHQGIDPQLVRSVCEQVIAEGERLQIEEMNLANIASHGASSQ
jgi:chorismate mutase